jgi:tetratricopeptide (TPR) repeat protein
MSLGRAYLALDRTQEALAQFESAARVGVISGDPRHEGYNLMSAGAAHERLQDPETAARCYLRAARLLEASYAATQVAEDQIGQGDALILHGAVARRRLGDTDAARASLLSAQRIARVWGDPDRLGRVAMELGALHWRAGELDAALEAFREALDLAGRHAMAEREIAALASLGVVYRDLGRFAEGLEAGRAAVERMEGRDDPLGAATLLTSLAASYRAAGEADAARTCLERASTLREGTGDAIGAVAFTDPESRRGEGEP